MNNTKLFFDIYNLSGKNPYLDAFMVFAAQDFIIIAIIIALIIFIQGGIREKKAFIFAVFALGISVIIVEFIRIFYIEPRPYITHPINPLIQLGQIASFPSTHTSTISTIAFSFWFYRANFSWFFIAVTLLIGFSRVFIGVHYPIDIIGGIITGLVSVNITWQIKRLIRIYFTNYSRQ